MEPGPMRQNENGKEESMILRNGWSRQMEAGEINVPVSRHRRSDF
jgi:hypothetical protein